MTGIQEGQRVVASVLGQKRRYIITNNGTVFGLGLNKWELITDYSNDLRTKLDEALIMKQLSFKVVGYARGADGREWLILDDNSYIPWERLHGP